MVNKTEPQIEATHSTHAMRLQDESRKATEHLDNEAINKKHVDFPTWRGGKWNSELSNYQPLSWRSLKYKSEYVYPDILNIQTKGNPHGRGGPEHTFPGPSGTENSMLEVRPVASEVSSLPLLTAFLGAQPLAFQALTKTQPHWNS